MDILLPDGSERVPTLQRNAGGRKFHNARQLNAFITVLDSPARARAKELDSELAQGKYRGPMHGVPVAVKDIFHMKGIRTTALNNQRVAANNLARQLTEDARTVDYDTLTPAKIAA